MLTCPSPAMTTRPRWRSERMVVARITSGTRVRPVIGLHETAERDGCRRPVCLERAQRRTSHRHDALLAALAEDAHEARVRVEMLPVEAGELAHAEARGVEQLEARAVAEAEEPVGPRRREQPVDVVERQVGGQLA